MTDEEIEGLIMKEIKKREITFHDMIGLANHGVDPNPEDKITPACEKGIRSNRFKSALECDRMLELLAIGKYNPNKPFPKLKVSFQDLFRFWWDRCVEQEYVLEDMLEDIYDYFREALRPPSKEPEESLDMSVDFEQIPLFEQGLKKAA